MAIGRESQRVAKRAVILGTIAFRSSLEVSDHPRVVEISQQLLPWLDKVGCGDDLDEIERELLATPLGQLGESLMADANWAGEAATIYCWMLNLVGPLDDERPADPSNLLEVLSILKPGATEILKSAVLRDSEEIQELCLKFVLIRSMLQEARVGLPGSDFIRRANLQRLNEVGLVATENAIMRASKVVDRMTPQDRTALAGSYFVRDHAALWFLSDRPRYFAT